MRFIALAAFGLCACLDYDALTRGHDGMMPSCGGLGQPCCERDMPCAVDLECSGASCARVAESDCLDGLDNNGDALADCADPTCDLQVQCADAPGAVGVLIDGACPTNYGGLDSLHQDLEAPLRCSDTCGCVVTATSCSHQIVSDSSNDDCSQPTTTLATFNATGVSGQGTPSGCASFANANPASVRVIVSYVSATCSNTGTSSPPAVTWARNKNFCTQSKRSNTCGAGRICVEKQPSLCVALGGPNQICPTSYPAPRGNWFHDDDYTDTRACSCDACIVSGSQASCLGNSVVLYDGDQCGPGGTRKKAFTTTTSPICQSGRLPISPFTNYWDNLNSVEIENFLAPGASCSASWRASGFAETTNGQTICCQ